MSHSPRGGVLYITYDGLLEPLGASQVLPYLRGARAAGVPVTVLSFEKPEDLADADRVRRLEEELAAEGTAWIRRRYHHRPTLPATGWDVLRGRSAVLRWVRETAGPRVVHARGYLPGFMAEAASHPEVRLLFDMRGFWVDERIEGGYWAPGSIQVRLGRAVERRVLEAADHLILLTRRGVERVGDLLPSAAGLPATVIPTCVDMERFRPPGEGASGRGGGDGVEAGGGEGAREARGALAGGPRPVLLHTGTLTGWYDGEATLAVARAFVERTGGRFVILTRDGEAARRLAAGAGLDPLVRSVAPEAMPAWLRQADAGLALVRPSPSKDASYPTKIGEYLAAGLAVLATPVGDLAALADGEVVDLLEDGDDPAEGAAWLAGAVARPDRVPRARALAEAELSLARGVERLLGVYRSLGLVVEGR